MMFWREEEEKEGNSHSVNNGDIFPKLYVFQLVLQYQNMPFFQLCWNPQIVRT